MANRVRSITATETDIQQVVTDTGAQRLALAQPQEQPLPRVLVVLVRQTGLQGERTRGRQQRSFRVAGTSDKGGLGTTQIERLLRDPSPIGPRLDDRRCPQHDWLGVDGRVGRGVTAVEGVADVDIGCCR